MASRPFYEQGNYVGEVVQQALGEASTGTPQFVLRVKVLGKPDPGDPSSFVPVQQYERTIFCSITANTIGFFTEQLQALGFTGSSFAQLDPSSAGFQNFTGRQLDLYCKHEPDNKTGDLREKWQISSSSRKPLEITPLSSKKTRELDSLFGKALKGPSVNSPRQQPPTPQYATAGAMEITDDDVPF